MSDRAYIGIDAGGSRLRLRGTTNQKQVSFETEGVNLWRDGIGPAKNRLHKAVRRALSELGPTSEATVVAGIAGAMDASHAHQLQRRLMESVSTLGVIRLSVLSDVKLAHHAAHGESSGITVVIGTGSVVFVRGASGQERIFGGWGHRLGDEGSGYAIGVAALKHLADSADRARTSGLESLVTPQPNESLRAALLRCAYQGRTRIQDLAPEVIEMAEAGREEAVELVRRQADLLVEQISLARSQTEGAPERIAFSGGLSSNSYYLGILSDMLRTLDPGVEIIQPSTDALSEALRMAMATAAGAAGG